ncbi:hypothetical protein BpHYR1_018395 [Brachionus plicatilis]|uniref:Uncharacterized protein n=1 Tax=Brachionus plicatilis TaxID=10195 RepID=A0A3M7P6R2_BRAPC|nr:hypothetical protein BpHYR1_018395 [Brachionus plicatilis]
MSHFFASFPSNFVSNVLCKNFKQNFKDNSKEYLSLIYRLETMVSEIFEEFLENLPRTKKFVLADDSFLIFSNCSILDFTSYNVFELERLDNVLVGNEDTLLRKQLLFFIKLFISFRFFSFKYLLFASSFSFKVDILFSSPNDSNSSCSSQSILFSVHFIFDHDDDSLPCSAISSPYSSIISWSGKLFTIKVTLLFDIESSELNSCSSVWSKSTPLEQIRPDFCSFLASFDCLRCLFFTMLYESNLVSDSLESLESLDSQI